ncbi:glutamate--tRNA ligase family protein [Paenibacillus sp. H1-7]|uniref:glutamate--tRNA ligase n=1 Tax=Paenibacillus sp. H1-7 TaxID=2282849 RepID=UPI001EF79004|nr:glutamate--tRNA ligase family protein [Paenibacillus sp. H1-7]
MTYDQQLADRLFPNVTLLPQDVIAQYPRRELAVAAKVTRFAPSPTGFLTIGGLYATFISERLAHQSGGVFYLRIEDTDRKREVKGSIDGIISALDYFGIRRDEGITHSDGESGRYGPYKQSARASIYHVFLKRLVTEGLAYPCFCDAEDLNAIREAQGKRNEPTGYYGDWAVYRHAAPEKVQEQLDAGKPYVIRLKSPGSADRKIRITDLIKGELSMPENVQDIVLMKSDGIPTYHFAHAVDDYLMGTTHVIRGDEWLSSLPVHVQLFEVLGLPAPAYGHLAPIMKMDGASKRKFSKRKDPDAAVLYYQQQGFPDDAISEYFMTLANSNYEEWRSAHPDEPYQHFLLETSRMSASGPLFDMHKLTDISKDVISRMTADGVYAQCLDWAKEYDDELYRHLSDDPDYAKRVFNIGRGGAKPRKDLSRWSDVRPVSGYFFDGLFESGGARAETILPPNAGLPRAKRIVELIWKPGIAKTTGTAGSRR